jgi:uridine kinase
VTPHPSSVLAEVVAAVPRSTGGAPVRVAVDGADGAGKSVFAGALATRLRAAGRPVVHASVDDFHRLRAERYRRGRDSPEGFWLDSFDYDRLRSDLLEPLSPGGSGRYRTAVHDLATDRLLDEPWQQAPAGLVLVLDGLFLHRDELHGYWDLSVFLDVPFAVTARRLADRDGTGADSLRRYVEAQRLYLGACRPADRATLVIDNTDWSRPAIRR